MNTKRFQIGERLAYSLEEASKVTGLSKGTLRNQHKAGNLKLVKCERRTLIIASDLMNFLAALAELKNRDIHD